METEGTTSQPLGNDIMGALMAQIEALSREMKSGNDAIRSDMDSMRGDMIRIRARVDRQCLPKSPQFQTPQVQRSYTSQNRMTPLHELETKESEAKPQDREKIISEVQEECEQRREKEGKTMGSEVGRRKKCLIVDLVHKGSFLFTNPNTSILPSILSSHLQVQDPKIP